MVDFVAQAGGLLEFQVAGHGGGKHPRVSKLLDPPDDLLRTRAQPSPRRSTGAPPRMGCAHCEHLGRGLLICRRLPGAPRAAPRPPAALRRAPAGEPGRLAARALHDVGDGLADAARHDAMQRVELDLPAATPVRFIHGALHRAGDAVGVEDRAAVQVARGTADGLDQRILGPEEAFLVGIEDRHQRRLRACRALRAAG